MLPRSIFMPQSSTWRSSGSPSWLPKKSACSRRRLWELCLASGSTLSLGLGAQKTWVASCDVDGRGPSPLSTTFSARPGESSSGSGAACASPGSITSAKCWVSSSTRRMGEPHSAVVHENKSPCASETIAAVSCSRKGSSRSRSCWARSIWKGWRPL